MKRGFTLIEVMAVVIILSIIGVIAVVAVDKTIKDNNEKIYKMQISNIEDAARVWANANVKYLPEEDNAAISIPLLLLKKEGIIDKEIKNPKTGSLFYDNMYIDIIYETPSYNHNADEGTYTYNVVEDSGTTNFGNLNIPIIILNDTLNKEIDVGDSVEVNGLVIYNDNSKKDLNDVFSKDDNFNSNTVGPQDYYIDVSGFTLKRKITVK